MAAALFTTEDYQAGLLSLLPPGGVWPRDVDTVLAQTMAGLAPSFARHDAQSQQLLIDAFPASAVDLLPEWEASLGLPDPCAGPSPTVEQRQAQVVARLTDVGGQSTDHFIGLAAKLGFTVTTGVFAPCRTGVARCGDPCRGHDWIYAWSINAPLTTLTQARAGIARAGEPLASWGNTVLQCELSARAPAHAVLIFSYT